tara:strand:+ start:45 stop:275 length:231 start_codon:yes stop_codon:yes gene_type:complete
MDQVKLNNMIKEKVNKIDILLNSNKINEQNKSLLSYTKNYLLGIYNSKENDILLQQESIKKILKKISIKISEIESS